MAASDDLINFDVIEAHKENIQALPSGRSAKKLAEVLSPQHAPRPSARQPLGSIATPSDTNASVRAEFEAEVAALAESDDPLDVYDRYVRWILDAYPSAQATPASQLHTVLERATKAFLASAQYRNDPRYLKLWLQYIVFFADAPRETFVFLASHGIGETLALFYEEYAGWLEGAGRWNQAEEVYKLGIEREARPQARLIRKFGEFEARRAARPEAEPEHSAGFDSPALPAMRPALAAKVDPFAAAERDPQAPRQTSGLGTQTVKPGRAKLQIFSDADSSAEAPAMGSRDAGSKGWDSIGSLADRKKENAVEAKPWVGETLAAGGKKSGALKMAVFRDTSKAKLQLSQSHITIAPSRYQVTTNPSNGKKERVFVDLQAVYPRPEEPGSELSFEEIWATNRGWLDRTWGREPASCYAEHNENQPARVGVVVHPDIVALDENGRIAEKHHDSRGRKKKVMEVNETQIIKAKLDSPSGRKMRKKHSAEPTMTMHTRAATDDIYDIFNAPLKRNSEEGEASGDDEDYETDSNYTTVSGAESTCTTRQVTVSEADDTEEDQATKDDETSDVRSLSEWSDFSTRRHVPDINDEDDDDNRSVMSDLINIRDADPSIAFTEHTITAPEFIDDEEEDLVGPEYEDLPGPRTRTTFVPLPPEDYVPNPRPFRDPVEVANNRLPFMTPITERTESSLEVNSAKSCYDRYGTTKTPSKRDDCILEEVEGIELEPLSSPLREVVIDTSSPVKKFTLPPSSRSALAPKAAAKPAPPQGPIIKEPLCNPVDDYIRDEILEKMQPPLSSYSGFHDHRNERYEKGNEIRKFVKAIKNSRSSTDRTANLGLPVVVRLPDVQSEYTLKKELGAGAFAPVYLVENSSPDETEDNEAPEVMGRGNFAVAHNRRNHLEALKMEAPPTPWEFHMMRLAHARLGRQHRATASLSTALEMHLFHDEGFLLLPYHPHGTLLDVVNLFRGEASGGVMDETLAMFFTIELLRTVEALHARGVMHGDLKPDNCLLRLDDHSCGGGGGGSGPPSSQWRADGGGGWAARGVTLIDFGRGIDVRAFAPDAQFIADWKTTAQDCAEVREGRPWTWQLDYHGLAGIVHCLLFGRYIETVRCDGGCGAGALGTSSSRRYRVRESFKRYWQTDIWADCFDLLLNPASRAVGAAGAGAEEGGRMPVLRGMRAVRERMEAWLEGNSEKGVGLRALLGRAEAAAAKARRG